MEGTQINPAQKKPKMIIFTQLSALFPNALVEGRAERN
jgi:hypothetical protein